MFYADPKRTLGRSTRVHAVAADRVRDVEVAEFLRASMTRGEREALERAEAAARAAEERTPEEVAADSAAACGRALDDLAGFCHIRLHAARWERLTLAGRASMVAHTMADMGACTRQAARTVAGQAMSGDLAGAVRGLERLRRAARGW